MPLLENAKSDYLGVFDILQYSIIGPFLLNRALLLVPEYSIAIAYASLYAFSLVPEYSIAIAYASLYAFSTDARIFYESLYIKEIIFYWYQNIL